MNVTTYIVKHVHTFVSPNTPAAPRKTFGRAVGGSWPNTIPECIVMLGGSGTTSPVTDRTPPVGLLPPTGDVVPHGSFVRIDLEAADVVHMAVSSALTLRPQRRPH